ncbi:hypothetical protein CDD81_341 [Ophiocordyceps australis]|uniref:Uncharacterized protein n=1 Tax=Ophiocordyceps australis TaxID=1399860 RepID=A0A2C5Y3G2_9HYPO|nr:hypothetical protein CDD81_341 [Ophiocordyceps australis]
MYCDSALSYQALFSVLPDDMQLDIWKNWNANQHHLGAVLYMEELSQQRDFIRESYAWYVSAAREAKSVCWHLDFGNQLPYHQSTLGAVNDLLVAPEWERYDMPRRLPDLPPGKLRIDYPICYNKTGLQYQWLRNQVRWMTTTTDAEAPYHSLKDLTADYLAWPGTIGKVMAAMMHKKYTCSPSKIACRSKPAKGEPFMPSNYTNFLDELKTVLRKGDTICFALSNVMPDDETLYQAYWFVPGIV